MKKLILLFLVACGPVAPQPKPFTGEATCETACENLQAMACEAVSCTELCLELVDYGAPYPVQCVTTAPSCQAADACE
jgi:hypothetical protein